MKKRVIVISAVLAALIAAGVGAYYVLFVRPYDRAESSIPQTGVKLRQDEAGKLTLSWPRAENADDYLVELKCGDVISWSRTCTDTSCDIPDSLELDGGATLSVTPRKGYETPRGFYTRPCDEPLTASYPAKIPSLDSLTSELDADADILTMTWEPTEGAVYTVTAEDGTVLATTSEGGASVAFGKDVPMPAKNESVTFTVTYAVQGCGVEFESACRANVDVKGEDLRGTKLFLTVENRGNNYYTFTWNETRGEHYELQAEDALGVWRLLASFSDSDELSYTLGPLEPFTDYFFRVVAVGGHTMPDSEFAATPSEVTVSTGVTTMYATIWVLKDLDVWSDTSKTSKAGVATTETSYCVMGEEDGFFLIYIDGARGYVDSTYCLINLPDYMGDLASYDIKNSYDSIYMVHDYGIPGITNTVITGYEQVGSDYYTVKEERTVRPEEENDGDDGSDPNETRDLYTVEEVEIDKPGSFLVPILYPTAQKLVAAALAAREDGYRLKIYDAYRPYTATRFIYDLTESLLENEIPAEVYSQMAGDKWLDYVESLNTPEEETPGKTDAEEQPDTEDGSAPGTEDSPPSGKEPDRTDAEPGPEEIEPRPSFYTVMTDGRYKLGAFLAKSGSYHNMGVAVDLTLEDIYTGEELVMQSAMHDLSWNSVLALNNDNAKLLAKYMTGANLATLSSEWWHFQDDELRKGTGDLVLRQNGVTRAGWTADGNGWRYRTAEGDFLTDGTYKVNGKSHTFDADGYSDYADWEN